MMNAAIRRVRVVAGARRAIFALALAVAIGAPHAHAGDVKILSANIPPYSIKDSDTQGFVAEVAKEIARRVGQSPELNYSSWSRVYRAIQKRPNRLLAPIARTPQREDKLTWVVPVYPDRMVVMTYGEDAEKLTLKEAAEKGIVGVQQDSLMHELAKKRGISDSDLDISGDTATPARKLAAGRIDAWLVLESMAMMTMKQQGIDSGTARIGEVIKEFTIYIGGSPDLPDEVVQKWREAFQAMKQDGTYQRIMSTYGV